MLFLCSFVAGMCAHIDNFALKKDLTHSAQLCIMGRNKVILILDIDYNKSIYCEYIVFCSVLFLLCLLWTSKCET